MSASKTASSARLEETELLRLRHIMGGLLLLVAEWGNALVDNASPTESLLAMLATLTGVAAPAWFASRGAKFWNLAGLAVVAVAVADLVITGVGDKSKLIQSVIRVALLIAVLRALQPRSRREDMQLILLALFLCAVSGALSLSPVFAVQVFLFIPLSGGILFLLNRLDGGGRSKAVAEDWANFRWRSFLSSIRTALTPATLLFLGGAMAAVIVWGAVIFTVLPRFRMDREMPFLKLQGQGRTGFSDSLSLGGISEIMRDESVALRADTPGRVRPIGNLYWRMIALDAYQGDEANSGFTRSAGTERIFRDNSGNGASWTRPYEYYRNSAKPAIPGDWKVFMEGNVANYLPVPGLARRIRFDKTQEWNENDRLRLIRFRETPSAGTPMLMTLGADSSRYIPAPTELPALAELTRESERDYPGTLLSLPKDPLSRTRLRETVAGFSKTPLTTGDFIVKASDWLAKRHAYALQDGYGRKSAPAGEPRDYLVRWMHSEATGWCEHFATSFVLLARASGRPARLVTGFSGGEWNESENYLVVRMKHAHAWVELFDRETGMWVRVDPTPPSFTGPDGAAADRTLAGSFTGLRAWYDSMTMLWFRRVVNFDEAERDATVQSAFGKLSEWGKSASEAVKEWRETALVTLREWAKTPAKIAPVAGIAFVGVAVLFFGVKLLRRLSSLGVRRARDDDPRVRRFRERAGRALARIDRAAAEGRAVDAPVRAAVEVVRFGAPASWPDPVAALDAVGPALRCAGRASCKL